MWDRLRKQVSLELEQLNRLLETHRPLLEKCPGTPPNEIEISALAGLLHPFYTGVENIFKRIAIEVDGAPPRRSEFWHRELLDTMTRPSQHCGPAISSALRQRLREYLEFRHFFRQAYAFQLHWSKMRSLVLGCEDTLRLLEADLETHLRAGLAKE